MTLLAKAALAAVLMTVAALPAEAGRILLTNDDGFEAPGIVALKNALEKAGHDVTIVAPSGNRSGSSAAITTTPITVEKKSDTVWSVDGTPATTVLFGLSTVMKDTPPDLVVSGTNEGANIGPFTVISGTVGNAVAALTQFNPSVPAIAFSLDPIGDADSKETLQAYKDVADYAVVLVRRMLNKDDALAKLGPVAINVNFPGVPKAKLAGVRYAVQGRQLPLTWGFREVSPGLWAINPGAPPTMRDVPQSDVRFHGRNFVTITVIDANYTASEAVRKAVRLAIGAPKP